MTNSLRIADTALESVRKHEQVMMNECSSMSHSFEVICTDLKHGWETALLDKVSRVISLCRAREAMRDTISKIRESQRVKHDPAENHTFQVSSLFLKECWEYLVSDPRCCEKLHLVTGTVTDEGTKVLSKMQKLRLKDQSSTYVRADDGDAHHTIISLEEDYGHPVLGMFHSHMSKGAGSTSPSSVDSAFLRRMEKLGCDCLGAIFSLDGFLRFYARRDFELQVYGKGLLKIHDNPSDKLFRISGGGRSK